MTELLIPKIEKEDIKAPQLKDGASAIVFQRHEKYVRTHGMENTGSLLPEHAKAAFERYVKFFEELFAQDTEDSETMLLFTSSDTRYGGNGYRSMETAQLAQDAAIQVMMRLGIDPGMRIVNLNPDFSTHRFNPTGQSIRPDEKIREPKIFDKPEYVDFLRNKYGGEDGPIGLSTKALAMHEMDAEREKREEFGAEGVYDIIDRTKKSLAIMERYASAFHKKNPHKKLLIWSASHYDTISPFVKQATDAGLDEYLPVDYGAGVVIELGPDSEPVLNAQNQKVILQLGDRAVRTNS